MVIFESLPDKNKINKRFFFFKIGKILHINLQYLIL